MSRKPTMEMSVASFFWMLLLGGLVLPLMMYLFGVYTGWRLYRHPTVHVEVQSRELEGKR